MEITPFETCIKNYLDGLAKEDKEFATTYKKANKNIKECCQYIYQEVQKMRKGQNTVGVADEEIYGLAIHYYDEDDIKVGGAPVKAEVTHVPDAKPKAELKAEEPKAEVEVEAAVEETPKPEPKPKTAKPKAKKPEPKNDNELPDDLIIPLF